MRYRVNDPFGIERGPEASGEGGIVESLVEGYHALGRVEVQTAETVMTDLQERIDRGEITAEQALRVTEALGI